MTLQRVQIPSPNYSSSRARSRLLVVHTSEGATTFRSLGNFLAQSSSGVSYHVGFDDTTSAQVGEYVQPPCKSWSAHSANNEGEHGCCCTPSGASSGWSRADWLARPRMLDACAAWLREEGARYGIPVVKIGPDQIRAGGAGVCGHGDCVQAGLGGSHTDPGANFPWDYVCASSSGGGDDDVNEQDYARIASDTQRIVTDVLRKEGVSGAKAAADTWSESEKSELYRLVTDVLRKENVSGAASYADSISNREADAIRSIVMDCLRDAGLVQR